MEETEVKSFGREYNYVKFKSIPSMYHKEKEGLKPNTLRKIDNEDKRFELLRKGNCAIAIINSETQEFFTREVTDYTEWDGYAIISWKH